MAFTQDLEEACVETIDKDGIMTKDLALAIHGRNMTRDHWVITDVYMDTVNVSIPFKLLSLNAEVSSCELQAKLKEKMSQRSATAQAAKARM